MPTLNGRAFSLSSILYYSVAARGSLANAHALPRTTVVTDTLPTNPTDAN